MAKICVFCGKELRAFSKDSLTFDTARQPVCGACRARLEDKSMLDCAYLALDSGRAAEPDVIRAYIDREEKKLQARREEDPFLVRTCSGCGAEVRRTEKDLALLAPNAVLPNGTAIILWICTPAPSAARWNFSPPGSVWSGRGRNPPPGWRPSWRPNPPPSPKNAGSASPPGRNRKR